MSEWISFILLPCLICQYYWYLWLITQNWSSQSAVLFGCWPSSMVDCECLGSFTLSSVSLTMFNLNMWHINECFSSLWWCHLPAPGFWARSEAAVSVSGHLHLHSEPAEGGRGEGLSRRHDGNSDQHPVDPTRWVQYSGFKGVKSRVEANERSHLANGTKMEGWRSRASSFQSHKCVSGKRYEWDWKQPH